MDEQERFTASPEPDLPPLFLRLWRRDYCPDLPARYVLAIMSFLGFCNVYALRVNLSMAIVEMDNETVTVRHGAEVSRSVSSYIKGTIQVKSALSELYYGKTS